MSTFANLSLYTASRVVVLKRTWPCSFPNKTSMSTLAKSKMLSWCINVLSQEPDIYLLCNSPLASLLHDNENLLPSAQLSFSLTDSYLFISSLFLESSTPSPFPYGEILFPPHNWTEGPSPPWSAPYSSRQGLWLFGLIDVYSSVTY